MGRLFQGISFVTLLLLLLGISDLTDSKSSTNQDFPTVYEYFGVNVTSGLVADQNKFWLNGKEIRLISGAMHYFRIHPALWRDRLKKLRATGANAVETYVSWNLHEPRIDEFDFGDGNNDFSEFMDIRRFIEIAQEEDLLVIFRPGPYICAEWDFGGFPSWLQRDPDMLVRSSYQPFLDRVKIYFDKLLSIVAELQFTRGGSVIAFQVENEYASFHPIDSVYLEFIRQVFDDNGLAESLYFTADNQGTDAGSLPSLLKTANTHTPRPMFEALQQIQPGKPFMVMESYAGWMDHWGEEHHTTVPIEYGQVLEEILGTFNGSVNFYMFHGGTNFGFMAGANWRNEDPHYHSDTTSYDYDAPMSEAGDLTEKYHVIRDKIENYQIPQLHRPELVPNSRKMAYPALPLQTYLNYDDIIDRVPSSAKFVYDKPVSMENLPMNGDNGPFSGQSYGYILYRTVASISNGTRYSAGPVKDFAIVLIDGKKQNTDGYWINIEREIALEVEQSGEHTVDIFVENMARINFGIYWDFFQQKGIAPKVWIDDEWKDGSIKIDGEEVPEIEVVALEFTKQWVNNLQGWRTVEGAIPEAPVLFQSTFEISDEPADTFLDMTTWHKGIVFVNGFNLGRYFRIGPQQTLYVPAPVLKTGTNTITIFEQLEPGSEIIFTDTPILATNLKK